MRNKKNNIIIVYDKNGSIMDIGYSIQRIINPKYYPFAEKVYHIYKNNDLNRLESDER